jgi:predicted glycosyl hydrolase (DUF1957 family)
MRRYLRICGIVTLLSFLGTMVFAEQPMSASGISSGGETRFWTDDEVDELITEVSEAAREAIELTAGEAAKAASIAAYEKNAELLERAYREVAAAKVAADGWKMEVDRQRSTGKRNAVSAACVAAVAGLVTGGLVVGLVRR